MPDAFHWLDSATVKISAGVATLNAALLKLPTGKVQIRVVNNGTVPVFIRKGTDSTVTAAVTDMPILAGATEVLTLSNIDRAPITHIAAITASGSADIYFTPGTGI